MRRYGASQKHVHIGIVRALSGKYKFLFEDIFKEVSPLYARSNALKAFASSRLVAEVMAMAQKHSV